MAIFILKHSKTFVIKSAGQQIITGPRGPEVVQIPQVVFKLKEGNNIVTDEEQIKRIRSDSQFGTSEIDEFTEDDQEAVTIRNKKSKEADEEIKTRKMGKKK